MEKEQPIQLNELAETLNISEKELIAKLTTVMVIEQTQPEKTLEEKYRDLEEERYELSMKLMKYSRKIWELEQLLIENGLQDVLFDKYYR